MPNVHSDPPVQPSVQWAETDDTPLPDRILLRVCNAYHKIKQNTPPSELRSCVNVEAANRGGPLVPNSPYDLCGRKAAFEEEECNARNSVSCDCVSTVP